MTNQPDLDFSDTARRLILSIYLPAFLMSMCQGIALLVIPLYALDLGANAGITALVFSLRGLGNVALDIPAGTLATRLGDKNTMLIGIAIMLAGAGLAGSISSPMELALCSFLFGGAMATWLVGRLTFISDSVDAEHRGKAIATMAGLQRLGAFLGPILTGILITQGSYLLTFICMGVLALATLILVLLFVPQSSKQRTDTHDPILTSLPDTIRQHASIFATAGLAMFMLTVIRACRQLLIPIWGDSLGLDPAMIGYTVGASSAVDMCLFPVAGLILDRFGRKPAALSCLFFLTAGIVVIPFTDSALTLALAAMLVGFGNGLGSGINMTLGADFSPAERRGEFIGVWRVMGDTGAFGGPMIIGALIETLSLATSFTFLGFIGLAGMLIMALLVKETLPRDRRTAVMSK